MTNQPTDSEIEAERRSIIQATVERMIGEGAVIAHPTVAARLERDFPGFDYQAKLDNFRTTLPQNQVPPMPAPIEGELAAVEQPDTGAPSVDSEATLPEPMDIESLRADLHDKEMTRAETRNEFQAAQAALGNARAILARSIATFLSGRPAMTSDQLAQSFCKNAAAERQQQKDQGRGDVPPAAVHARSAIDRGAAWAQSGGATAFLQKQMKNGGHRRGAYPQAMRGQFVGVPKVPSEQ